MEKVTFNSIVGFVLAVAFAIVMAICMNAVLIGDYMQPNSVMNDTTRNTLQIVGYAGGLAALVAWWVQQFAATRGFLVRFLFALFVFVVAFCSFGGLLRVIYLMITYPNQLDWSLSGLYWSSLSDFYSFVLFMLVPPRPGYAGLMLAAALYLAIFGPRGPKTIRALTPAHDLSGARGSARSTYLRYPQERVFSHDPPLQPPRHGSHLGA
jgi:hypothetical protein